MESNEELTPGELKKKAMLMALRLKNSGLDAETIYARLEKQGIPEEMAKQIAYNSQVERKREEVKEAEEKFNYSLLKVGIGVVAALISYLIFPDFYILPVGLIVGGIVAALLAKKRMEE